MVLKIIPDMSTKHILYEIQIPALTIYALKFTSDMSTYRNLYTKLEDLKVLRRSPDLINNVKIGQGFTAYNKTYFVIPYMGVAAILVK